MVRVRERYPYNLFIFTGTERRLMDYYLKELAEDNDATIKQVDINELETCLKSGTSLLEKSIVFVVKDNNIEKIDTKKILNSLNKRNFVVFIVEKLDKRLLFYKQNEKYVIECIKLTDKEFVEHYKDTSPYMTIYHTLIKRLAQRCDYDMGRFESEVNKASNLPGNINDNLNYMLDNNLIYKEPLDAVFSLVDAILKYQPELAYEMYDNCKRIGEANLVILSNLFTSAKHLLQVQAYKGKNITKETGLSQWQINLVKDKVGINSNRRLINIMRLVQRIEEGIKKGEVDDELSVDLILANLFKEVNVYEG